ncbi:uncharacterized protein LOC125956380 [Anopheles darlingi]|uniref:uncharacterized protein LOC125956380 n=1 Tax=Anopheles darlingi TaxID=43151 RepID=UPI00210034AC|nr:uncharacterized protein LOC125956380 [Anopheles darlingi]
MAALFASAGPVAIRSVSNNLRLVGRYRSSSNISAIDSFISDLVDNKKLKWKVLNSRHRNGQAKTVEELPKESTSTGAPATVPRTSFNLSGLFAELTQNPLVVNISSMDVPQVDHLIETALAEQNDGDVKLLLEQIVLYRKIPSAPVVDKVLRHVAVLADTDKLASLIDLFSSRSGGKDANAKPVQQFDHYKALCLWKAGNTLKSLESFREIAKHSRPEDLFLVDQILRELIDETIGKKSEAVLLAVMGLCEYCLTDLRHEFPICYVWEKSFHSSWHSDQEAARTLFDRHANLRTAISKRLSNLCYKLLYDNNVEKVYQLMEHFLKHNMKPECTHILIRLFDYQYWRKNLRGCSEIMQNAVDLDIVLPELYNRRLLELLLGRASLDPSVTGSSKKSIVPKTRKYELKF